ncbi:unnamed protein product [Tenebrio molitor]|nr:unnamed protein product [Tenebrio molitor]
MSFKVRNLAFKIAALVISLHNLNFYIMTFFTLGPNCTMLPVLFSV